MITATSARLDRIPVLLIVVAVVSQDLMWSFYDAQVPASLRTYVSSATVIGLVMSVDNVIAVVVQPCVGHWSDRYRRRTGTRVPFLLAGAPLAAVAFVLIPWTSSLPQLLACVVCFAFFAHGFGGVTETLLPDHVPTGSRSRAHAFVKVGTSATVAAAAAIGLLVVDGDLELAFAIPAATMLVGVLVVWVGLRRRPRPSDDIPAAEPAGPWAAIRDLLRDPARVRPLLVLGIVCVAGAWSAMRSLLTPYAIEVLHLTRGQAGGLLLPGSLAFIIAAVPFGFLAERVGQVRTILAGLAVFIVGVLIALALPTPGGTATGVAVGALGYAAFSVNAVVALWDLAPSVGVLGLYTGLYTVADSVGYALGPVALGGAIDATAWRLMFLDVAVLAAMALVVFVRLARRMRPEKLGRVSSPGRP